MQTGRQRLDRFVAIEPGEGTLVGWAAATFFLVEWASVAVSNTADTLFLKRVGVDYLPIVFLVNSALLTVTTFAASRVAVRYSPRVFLPYAFSTLAVVLLFLWGLVLVQAPGVAVTLVLASKQIGVLALLLLWMVLGDVLTSRQNKRLAALMTAGGTVGTIAGSFTSGPLGRLLGIPSLLAVAAATLAVAAAASVALVRSAPVRLASAAPRSRSPAVDRPSGLRAFWSQSALFRVLVGTSFLAGLLGPMLYFEFSVAADLATRTVDGEQRLLALYGALRGWINVGVLVVQVAGSAMLFRYLGVPLAAILAPLGYLAGFTGLSVRFGLVTAMPASMATSVIDHTVFDPGQRILGALLPQRMRAAAASLVHGPAKRFGAALGSLLILVVVTSAKSSMVAPLALPFAALWLGLSLWLWRNYASLLLEAASVRDEDERADQPFAELLDGGTLRVLRQSLEGEDEDQRAAACNLFEEAPVDVAVDALASAVALAPRPGRPRLLESLEKVLSTPAKMAAGGARAAHSLCSLLEKDVELSAMESATLVHLLGGLVGLGTTPDLALGMVRRALTHRHAAVVLAARLAELRLIGASSVELDVPLAAGLQEQDVQVRSIALRDLRFELLRGDPATPAWRERLDLLEREIFRGGLGDSVPLREAAAMALADVAAAYPDCVESVLATVLALAGDQTAAVRAAALRFLGNARRSEHAALLAQSLSSRFAVEAAAAHAAISMLGSDAAEALLHALRHGSRRAREGAADLLRDIPVDTPSLRGCMDRELEQCREHLVVLGVLDSGGLSPLVIQRLEERADESMLAALELLAAILGEDRISHVSRCLGRGRNQRERAVLLEALETLLPAAERRRFLPLLEEQNPLRLAKHIARATGQRLPSRDEALARAVAGQDSLATGLLAATLEPEARRRVLPDLDEAAALKMFVGPSRHVSPNQRGLSGGHGSGASADTREEETMLSPVEKMLHLRTLDLFDGLTTRQLTELSLVTSEVVVETGEAILREGEFDDAMYFIVSGMVQVAKAGQLVAELGARDFFGEMSVFDGQTRSATVTAKGQVRLLCLLRNDLFEVMEDQSGIGVGICQTLVRRLRGLLDERSR